MSRDFSTYRLASRVWHGALIALIVGFASYAPHAVFQITPFATGNSGAAAPANVTSHTVLEPVAPAPDTPFEARVRAETYKWCGFCHTTTQNGEHLIGPNLYGIFGQRAGTAPNYSNYSDAMVAARDGGLVWTDETINAYIADPQHFMPGTNMMISIGPIEDAATREALISILRRETMAPPTDNAAEAPAH